MSEIINPLLIRAGMVYNGCSDNTHGSLKIKNPCSPERQWSSGWIWLRHFFLSNCYTDGRVRENVFLTGNNDGKELF